MLKMLRFNPILLFSIVLCTSLFFLRSSWANAVRDTVAFNHAVGAITHRSRKISIGLTGHKPGQNRNPKKGDGAFDLAASLARDASAHNAGPLSFQHSNYTADVVIPHFQSEDLSWLSRIPSTLRPIVYTNSSSTAPLSRHAIGRVIGTKGHEALTYLTHIVNQYDELSEITIFLHPHPIAWHNNDLLSLSTPLTLSRLNPHHIISNGYFNLRCHWDPGCPTYLHPSSPDPNLKPGDDSLRQEEPLVAQAWASLFPTEPIPSDLAQPCCGQFAVSRAQILTQPKERYIRVKAWLEETDLSDYLSGRVLEYLWQYLFTKEQVSCPDMRHCYCAAYGVCFGSEERFQSWFEMKWRRGKYVKELERWIMSENEIENFQRQGKVDDVRLMDRPEPGRIDWLEREIEVLEETMERVKREAWERGRDPNNREND